MREGSWVRLTAPLPLPRGPPPDGIAPLVPQSSTTSSAPSTPTPQSSTLSLFKDGTTNVDESKDHQSETPSVTPPIIDRALSNGTSVTETTNTKSLFSSEDETFLVCRAHSSPFST
jgi:hypothetical protein